MTVQHNSFSSGSNIVQWQYTGFDENNPNDNQKWKFEIIPGTNGMYCRIVTATAPGFAISLFNGSLGTKWQSPATTNHVSIYDMTHYSSILLSQVIRAGDAVFIGNLKSVCIYYENNHNADYVRFIHVD